MISATALATMPAAAGQLPWQALGSVDKPKDGPGECDDGGSVPAAFSKRVATCLNRWSLEEPHSIRWLCAWM